ncbi:MAG TPA: NADH-quinone oxidoreductase subunit A [Elusimicrobiota bacterium]|jgi:NADH-quinone oxidoreductase subunit A|nr:NADH-quinone oxidoreductase subunit A [Elusimicrobiota bacterium]
MSHLALFALAVDFAAVLALTGLFANAGKLFGPKSVHEGDAEMPYETGLPPLSAAHERMTVLYHRFAVLFVVFDVDLAFLLPWALNKPALSVLSMAAITGFTLVLLFMLAYFWRKGALECR